MSITLVQPTPSILPTFNRILYRISSTNANETGFKYVVKVYNISNELIATAYYDSPANPADEVEFDISKLVSAYYNFTNGFYQSGTSLNSAGIIFPFYIKCYEYYMLNDEYVIVLNTEVVSTTKYGLAAALPVLEKKNWYANFGQYNGSSTTIYKPLTDWTINKCRSTDSQIIGFYNDGKVTNLELLVTYANGTTTTFYITPTAPVGNMITYFKVTPLTYGATTDNIQLFVNWANGGARRYAIGTIYVQSCGKYDPVRIAYLNQYGTYDFFNFDLVSKTSFDIEKKGYQKDYSGDIYNADNIIVKNTNPIYYTKETQKYKLNSDYLTDAQSVLIRQLYNSPLVYMNLVNDTQITPSWIPVKPIANSYELKQSISDKLFNLELDVEFGLVNTRQSV